MECPKEGRTIAGLHEVWFGIESPRPFPGKCVPGMPAQGTWRSSPLPLPGGVLARSSSPRRSTLRSRRVDQGTAGSGDGY